MTEHVQPDSLITLNYRVASTEGEEWISTFDFSPAVIQLGCGELAPPFEACLIGQLVGTRIEVVLKPEETFGLRQAELVRRVARSSLPASAEIEINARAELNAPSGQTLSGIIREIDNDSMLIDFNHPLAGKSIRFEAEIIGVL
ncbi:MAG: peptidylprolyl isomerase [Rugosibacter sp.]|jgi:FKBP-type peptidyl-prolyl cis-trans isomerase SlpA|nr:peptidylprolyl isomerase [Rugosibacter sp.]